MSAAGLIGPNAVLRLVEALDAGGRRELVEAVFASAGAEEWLVRPPEEMVDEQRVARLFWHVRRRLTATETRGILADAGRRTADYLLARRIPGLAQTVLRALPSGLAARILAQSITANAWTFAGSGRFHARVREAAQFTIRGNPFCSGKHASGPCCEWHASVFRRLFQALVSPRVSVVETGCEAAGHDACRFQITWLRAP